MNTNDSARAHRHVGGATAVAFLVLLLLGALHHSADASVPAAAPAPAATSAVPAPTRPGQGDPNLVPRGHDGFGHRGGGGRFGGGGGDGAAPAPTPAPGTAGGRTT